MILGVIETWMNSSKAILMFRIKNETDYAEEVCGITQIAINDYF